MTQLNLLSSHDIARLLSVIGGETDKPEAIARAINSLKLCTLLLMTFPGAPSVYYGDEVGMWGGNDPSTRKPMLSRWLT